jgi:hypothetical protein
MVEGIERPLRSHWDREQPVVWFPHLDPQLPRSLPPEQPHLGPVRRAHGQLPAANRRHRGPVGVPQLGVDRIPTRAVRLDEAELVRWFVGHVASFRPGSRRAATAASPTTGEKIREIAMPMASSVEWGTGLEIDHMVSLELDGHLAT